MHAGRSPRPIRPVSSPLPQPDVLQTAEHRRLLYQSFFQQHGFPQNYRFRSSQYRGLQENIQIHPRKHQLESLLRSFRPAMQPWHVMHKDALHNCRCHFFPPRYFFWKAVPGPVSSDSLIFLSKLILGLFMPICFALILSGSLNSCISILFRFLHWHWPYWLSFLFCLTRDFQTLHGKGFQCYGSSFQTSAPATAHVPFNACLYSS